MSSWLTYIPKEAAETDEEQEIEEELEFLLPITPTIDTKQRDLEEKEADYSASRRYTKDFVLSGPIIGGWGPGRYHQNRAIAEAWCKRKYGAANVKRLDGITRGRWAFLIKRG